MHYRKYDYQLSMEEADGTIERHDDQSHVQRL